MGECTGAGTTTVAVVLAAGGGSRFGSPTHKLASPLANNETVAARAVRAAIEGQIGPVVVVVGAVEPDELGLDPAAIVVTNPRWRAGQATSLQLATGWARECGAGAVVVGLGDQPGLAATAWRAVAAATTTPLAIATYDGRRGHPIRLAAEVWPDLPKSGDEGARQMLNTRLELVTEVPCSGDPTDIDTTDDLERWRRRGNRD